MVSIVSCQSETGTPPPEQVLPSTGGSDGFLTGVLEGGSADDTGGEPMVHGCDFKDNSAPEGAVLIRHQCSFEYDMELSYEFNGSPAGHAVGAVVAVNESSYEHPFVAACCTDVTEYPGYDGNSCATPHQKACVSDLIEHLCAGPSSWMAEEAVPLAEPIFDAASIWFNQNRAACYSALWLQSGLDSMDFCSELGSVELTWSPSVSFESLVNELDNFELTVNLIGLDSNPVLEPPAEPLPCNPMDNNGEIPPYSDPGQGGILGTASSNAVVSLTGPQWMGEVMTGQGTFDASSSQLRYEWAGSDVVLLEWAMFEAGPTTAGTSSISSTVDSFSLRLLQPVVAAANGGLYSVAAGDAHFHMQATVEGVGEFVGASNANTLSVYDVTPGNGGCPSTASACLRSRPFTIGYTDVWSDYWELDVPQLLWVR